MPRSAELAEACQAVVHTAVTEAQRQAAGLVARPETLIRSGLPAQVAASESLLSLYLQSAAGLDVTIEVAMQRRFGATWHQIGAATGMTRQSAHERWSTSSRALLDRYQTGEFHALAEPDSDIERGS